MKVRRAADEADAPASKTAGGRDAIDHMRVGVRLHGQTEEAHDDVDHGVVTGWWRRANERRRHDARETLEVCPSLGSQPLFVNPVHRFDNVRALEIENVLGPGQRSPGDAAAPKLQRWVAHGDVAHLV